jgi:hypothetical protein
MVTDEPGWLTDRVERNHLFERICIMKFSWKTSFVAISALGLLAAVTVQNAMASGHGHSGAGSHSMEGKAGKSNRYDKGRFDSRYRDFRRSWYGDRYGRYGYDYYSRYYFPSFPYYPSCYEPCYPSYCPSNPPCTVFAPTYPCYPSCYSSYYGPSCGFDDYCGGGWDIYGRPYRHRDRDYRPGEKGGEHRLGSLGGHGNSSGMPTRIASSGSHGSHR